MSKFKLISSVEELKILSQDDTIEVFIALNGGLRSSKQISFTNGEFYITNEIDDSSQVLTPKELFTESNIGKAIELNSLYLY
jgi:hypothetical protein